jgi:hypothetical protein
MKIFLDDIKKIDWLKNALENNTKWGKDFLNLKKGYSFVFDYDLNESNSTVIITNHKVLYEVNESIYRNMTAEHVGYMKEPFESSNYLFFSMLKRAVINNTFQDPIELQKLIQLFTSYKEQDYLANKRNLKTSIKGNQEVNSSISFSNALNNVFSLNPDPVHGLCMVYELIDGYTKRTHNKTIYGELLTNIVKAVKNPNGGLLPEYAGSTMRYMIIGQKAGSNDPDLKKAKELFRSGNNPYSIYVETGWFFNKFDNKWRKKVSDDSFEFDLGRLANNGNQVYVLPEGFNESEIRSIAEDLVSSNITMAQIIAGSTYHFTENHSSYNVRLGDYVNFEEVFAYYPNLKNIFSFFALNMFPQGNYAFYFSPEVPYSLVLISGEGNQGYDLEKIKYVALHEIQHYIQTIEGFGSGGNDTLANLVSAVGGKAVRSFFISLSAFQKKFSEVATFIPFESYRKLVKDLEDNFQVKNNYKIRVKLRNDFVPRFINVSEYYKSILLSFSRLTKDMDSINQNAYSISYYILTMYSMIEETNEFIEPFIVNNVGDIYIDFFKQALEQNKKTVARDLMLSNKGWSEKDLYILNFQAYESLIGEVESRFTQQTTHIPKELKNYFEFYTSETIESDKVNVISNNLLVDEGKNVAAGIETYEDKYIIHLPDKYSNSIALLHETGHILFDFASEQVYANPESITNAVLYDYENVEEYFCDSFVDYIQRKKIDPALTVDLEEGRSITNYTEFDAIFESMLYSTTAVDESGILKRLNFVMKILE